MPACNSKAEFKMLQGLCSLLVLLAIISQIDARQEVQHASKRSWRKPARQVPFPKLTAANYEATLKAAWQGSMQQPQRRKTADVTRRPFKVFFDYQLDPSTSAADADYLQNTLLPAMAAVLEQFVQVKEPVVGNLKLVPNCVATTSSLLGGSSCAAYDTTCADGDVAIPQEHLAPFGNNPGGPGVDADLIVYVLTERQSRCGADTLAAATGCLQDLKTNRPTAGTISFCNFGPNQFALDLETSVHEIIHVLGLNSQFFFNQPGFVFRSFIDDNGAPLVSSEIAASFAERGTTANKIILPRVKAAAQAQFGCPTLNGAELEDDGGDGTSATHWEQRIFEGELMDGTGGGSSLSGRHVLTNITLALLEDTGWYTVNYAFAATNRFGAQAGCLFPTSTCKDILASSDAAAKRFFCSGNASEPSFLCSDDYGGIGTCYADQSWDGCSRVLVDSSGECAEKNGVGGPQGPGARCIVTTGGSSVNVNSVPQCAAMSCSGANLMVKLDDITDAVQCPSGQIVDTDLVFTSSNQPVNLVCPDNALMCATTGAAADAGYLTCPNDCNLQGRCQKGVCQCFLGFVGPDCSQPICVSDASCNGTTTCHSNGQCLPGPDVVEQFSSTPGGLNTGRAAISGNSSSALTSCVHWAVALLASMLPVIFV